MVLKWKYSVPNVVTFLDDSTRTIRLKLPPEYYGRHRLCYEVIIFVNTSDEYCVNVLLLCGYDIALSV